MLFELHDHVAAAVSQREVSGMVQEKVGQSYQAYVAGDPGHSWHAPSDQVGNLVPWFIKIFIPAKGYRLYPPKQGRGLQPP